MMFWRAFRGLLTFLPLALCGMDVLNWTVGGIACGLGVAAILVEAFLMGNHSSNSDAWEGLILLESAAIATLLAGLHLAVGAGFLVLAPYVGRRHQAEIGPRTAFVAATLILFAGWATGRGWLPTTQELVTAAGIAALAWIFSHSTPKLTRFVPSQVPAAFAPLQPAPDEMYEALRERYRRLRAEHHNMERESSASRAIVTLAEWRSGEDRTPTTLAKTVRDLAKVEGAAIYVVPDARDGFALAGSSGKAPNDIYSLPGSLQVSPIVLRETAERELKAASKSISRVATVLLTDRGRLVGLAALFDQDKSVLEAAVGIIERISSFAASVVRDEQEIVRQRERISQLELINRFSGRTGGGNPSEVANTICEDVSTELGLDGCAIIDLTDASPKILAGKGDSVTDLLYFASGADLKGWMGSGASEVVIDDARSDRRCDDAVALRRGVGSVVLMPLVSSGNLVGAFVSWTAKRRGISSVAIGTLRALGPYVLRQVFGGFSTTKPGFVDSDTFWNGTQGPGSFVEIDLGRSTEAIAPQELQAARRQLLTTALGRLPYGGLITRRSAGTLLAFLPGYDDASAERWTIALRQHADQRWEMRVDGRGNSQQTRQFLQGKSA